MRSPVDDNLARDSRYLGRETSAGRPESVCGDDSSEDESESEGEGDNDYRQRRVSVKDLLDRILQGIREGTKDLTDSDEFASFKASDGDHLASNTGDSRQPTALHIMAAMDKKALPKLDGYMEPLIKFLVQRRENLLKVQDKSGHTPLYLAIEARKEKMVQWMCDGHESVQTVLDIASVEKMNCLHIAVDKRVKFLDFLVQRADPGTLAAKDSDGNTPLHLAVEYKKCRKGQLAIIERIVSKSDEAVQQASRDGDFNRAGLSPYLHHKESVTKAAARDEKKIKEDKEREKSSGRGRPDPGEADGPSAKDPAPGRKGANPSSPRLSGIPFSQQPDGGSRVERRPNQAESRTKYGGGQGLPPAGMNSIAESGPPAVLDLDGGKKTGRQPDSTLKGGIDAKAAADSGHKSSSKVDKATVSDVERFLKLHYLRSRSYNAAMEILYGRNTTSGYRLTARLDMELYFDLSGHANITQTGFENLMSKLKFEEILQYVAIPRISVEVNMHTPNSKRSRVGGSRSSKPDGAGRRDLCYIFERLRKKGVKTILKVIVDDSVAPAHSDEAIESALKLMDVEVWDWKKTDLCSEVIRKVASRVREVHLYWSGNNAVLRGWSEEGGLKTLPELRKAHLHVQQGLESRTRTQQNVNEFYNRMKKVYPDVTIFKDGPELQHEVADINALRIDGDQGEHSTKHEWIQCMKEFRKLLFDAERSCDQKIEDMIEEPIKVAVIDDGVDVKDLEYTFIGGRTFCTRDEEHNLNDPYYVSSAGHGTVMAKQIHLLCPRAQFYVLRLEDHPCEGGRQITARSAAQLQAIHAAVRKKVHIISMSWTIDPPEDENERRFLDSAILEAANADILMFCSASDKGAKQRATYPAKATGKIFTIGAATASGTADQWVGNLSNISFTFPGSQVPLDDDTALKGVTGSSVATALAAGLAALILYCVQVRLVLATDQEKHKTRRDFQALRKYDQMIRAFKDIGTTEASNYKFIEVWEVFGKKVEERDQYDQERWIELIAEVGTSLCRKI
ncbi:hypothetical protein QQX98_008761 [Neonectria punicea]|uniref:Peptidase S8/S53 domain-containing protein n=1 Tax=Neonectria punicea TaxID=979145 RepID=A0ABR1GU54_9HYPO